MIKKAQEKGAIVFNIIDIRDFATDSHQTTDDRPFGGGPGMVMKIEPIDLALHGLGLTKDTENKKIVLTSAKGKMFDQNIAKDYSKLEELVLICGHYEGVDERVSENLIDEELRIGDYVLTGGEPAVAVVLDAVTRLLPDVLGNQESHLDESHSVPGKLGHPSYTRPSEYKGMKVPEVLLTGDHQKIDQWRKDQEK
jgi:tRNA (guanine37-N1)-methyltransferase